VKSILPGQLEAKRLQIAREHNKLVVLLLLGFFALLFTVVALTPDHFTRAQRAWFFIGGLFLVVGPLEAFAIYRILERDKEMCKTLGFMCPHCHGPLYEPRSFISINGLCPQCHQSII
jgi:hypothetical protein